MKVEWRRWCPALEDVPLWRSNKFPPLNDVPVPDSARSQEDLLRELEYLRAENAYLKKLDALIQSKKEAARKKRS